ncbi:type II toxin-antitoxin system VapC family toxin [Nitrosophilus labii]|uniref:type II toxin-antitoxin system VapC family toxin n=1 Tax=Nitrosophilus labii TaxID=2706014 RepID=UPI001657221E|nr:PIN domain-containing protein [Nitrosophilus labii]
MKLFLDTNIFLDLLFKREFYNEALEILNTVEKGEFSGYILDITILNIDYVAKKQLKNIKEFIKLLSDTFEIVGADNEIIQKALSLENEDFEDSVQYIVAKNLNCDVIITNDKGFIKSGNIEILSSKQFFEKYIY